MTGPLLCVTGTPHNRRNHEVKISKRAAAFVGLVAVVMAGSATTGAVAGDLIRSKDIADGAVHGVDLSKGVNARLSQTTSIAAGAGYDTTWKGDGGKDLQTVREECPEGEYATGGGFSTFGGDKDLGGDNKSIQ